MDFAPKLVIRTLALLVVAVVLLGGTQVFHFFSAHSRFKKDVSIRAEIWNPDRSSTGSLRDAIYRDAQRNGIPLEREDINVESDTSGPRVTADYRVTADLRLFQFPITFHTRYPAPKEIFTPFHRFMLSGVGLVLGIYLFFEGFVVYWKYRVLADTPLTPIRGMAMGRVEIQGKAAGEKTLLSPVSNQPCFLYLVYIDRWVAGRSGSGRWSHYLTDEVGVRFYLEDETGRVLVDPRDAEYDLQETFQCEISKQEALWPGDVGRTEKPRPSYPGQPPSNEELRSYVRQVAHGVHTGLFHGADWPAGGFANSKRKKPRRGSKISFNSLSNVALLAGLSPAGDGFNHSPGDYRLTEYCILSGESYDILGTCAENPDSKTEADRHVIMKGQNDPLFFISSRSEKTLEADLRGRALRHILGGAALAIGGTAALLEVFGLLA